MKRILFTLAITLAFTKSFSQTYEYATMHFIEYQVLNSNLDKGIPFVKIGFSAKNEDCPFYPRETDQDGIFYFHINPDNNQMDNVDVWIKVLQNDSLNSYGEPFKVDIMEIAPFRPYEITNELKIILTEYKVLSRKEYKKHLKLYSLIPERVIKK